MLGRIKTTYVKNVAKELLEKYPNLFTGDYEKNKETLEKVCRIKSKRLRNTIAGYIASLLNSHAKG